MLTNKIIIANTKIHVLLLTLGSLVSNIQLADAQVGGTIYQPIPAPKSVPLVIPKLRNIQDEFYLQQKRELELNILREQNKALQKQNNGAEEIVFEFENINYLDRNFRLTKWEKLNNLLHLHIGEFMIRLVDQSGIDKFRIKDVKELDDKTTEFYTQEGVTIGVIMVKKGVYMIIFKDNEKGFALLGGMIKS